MRVRSIVVLLFGIGVLLAIAAPRFNGAPQVAPDGTAQIAPSPTSDETAISSEPDISTTVTSMPPTPATETVAPTATEQNASSAEQPAASIDEWTQDAHNPQRTGFTTEEPLEPWTLLWTWNGPDENGGAGEHFYDAPHEARTITGGGHVYVPAGSNGLYALAQQTGQQVWHLQEATFNATPAYDPASGFLYAGGDDGRLYKIEARSGEVVATYDAGSALNKSILLVDDAVYGVTEQGELHKINAANMQQQWVYHSESTTATPPAYSATRDVLVFCTDDLFVHAVDNATGTEKWRVKPSPNPAGFPNEFDGQWPVIAEQSGVVFVRMRLMHDALWSGPGAGGMYPNSNTETRQFLESKPELKNLFALSLDTGAEAFVPAVGYGGVEGLVNDQPYLDIGPVPVIKTLPDGHEVAYQFFRNGQSAPPDGRWDSHVGEMTLDDQTVPGMTAGDLRFVQWLNKFVITDEQTPMTMAGDTLFVAHWGASESARIVDRSPERGLSYADPITIQPHPTVIRRQQACDDFDPTTHWTTCGLTLFDDGRYWGGPGWWVYWNVLDPPTPSRDAYSDGIRPRYTYVSAGLVIVQGNGGELFVLKHSGSPE
jgi:hypothetical protein